MELQGLRTTIYFVVDIVAARDWYTKVLGIAPYYDTPYYVGYNIGGYELGLHPQHTTDAQPATNNQVAYWGVENIAATYQNMIANGAIAHEVPNDVGGGIMVASVLDPWGNALGIIYNPHFVLG